MKKHNWVAQDEDGCIYLYDKEPKVSPNGNWWRLSVANVGHRQTGSGDSNPNWKESLIDLSKNDYIIKDGILMATRKHAALIHAWADGAEIQFKSADGVWYDCDMPIWDNTEFRIKPKTRTVKFRNYHVDGVMGVWAQGYQGLPGNATLIDKDWQEVEIEL